jgi:glycosyltransferase involved in cell wall biosynthesis
MHVSILGTRGIPVSYGGFEPLADRLARHLVQRGMGVTVYGLNAFKPPSGDENYHGINRVWLPSIKRKALEKPLASLSSVMHAAAKRSDVILMLGVSPVLFSPVVRGLRQRLIVNVDGLEWKRRKWGKFGRGFLWFSEWMAAKTATTIVADAHGIADYYRRQFNRDSYYIPYGAPVDEPQRGDNEILEGFGLKPRGYVLQICRLEPENNADWAIEEYVSSSLDIPYVLVGDAPYGDVFEAKLRGLADNRVRLLGRVSGEPYRVLQRNALIYVHGHEVGGTNPSLLDALGAGNYILGIDVPFNREVLGQSGQAVSRQRGRLKEALEKSVEVPSWIESQRSVARQQVLARYQWPAVCRAYEEIISNPDKPAPYDSFLESVDNA